MDQTHYMIPKPQERKNNDEIGSNSGRRELRYGTVTFYIEG